MTLNHSKHRICFNIKHEIKILEEIVKILRRGCKDKPFFPYVLRSNAHNINVWHVNFISSYIIRNNVLFMIKVYTKCVFSWCLFSRHVLVLLNLPCTHDYVYTTLCLCVCMAGGRLCDVTIHLLHLLCERNASATKFNL